MSSFSEVFEMLRQRQFFPKYARSVKNFHHKYRKKDGNGKPIDFNEQDKAAIAKGLRLFAKQIERVAADIAPTKMVILLAIGALFGSKTATAQQVQRYANSEAVTIEKMAFLADSLRAANSSWQNADQAALDTLAKSRFERFAGPFWVAGYQVDSLNDKRLLSGTIGFLTPARVVYGKADDQRRAQAVFVKKK